MTQPLRYWERERLDKYGVRRLIGLVHEELSRRLKWDDAAEFVDFRLAPPGAVEDRAVVVLPHNRLGITPRNPHQPGAAICPEEMAPFGIAEQEALWAVTPPSDQLIGRVRHTPIPSHSRSRGSERLPGDGGTCAMAGGIGRPSRVGVPVYSLIQSLARGMLGKPWVEAGGFEPPTSTVRL
ncbi:hypothetical protein NITHO_1140006 [Nitrolancea hollandica Lb]|uniref:Uncharacterized protein n=1 Tax=Nitrolancea hollandica Lb TaxID=1129897 RepID=I4ECN1_9BACT|nr:hypothetical protein NITHO_1140006 [Nitrolancea hollandica Lb]